jgi:acyl-CoA synthetase (AMP-forming)/AMP-acid ligase II
MDPLKQVTNTAQSLATLTQAGIIRIQRPDRAVRTALALIRWGVTPAAGYEAAAAQYPDEVAIIDELGQLTFREVSERTNALAHALADDGVNEGDSVAIMARNHRGFVDAVVACSKLGAHALFMNTSFSGPQLKDVADREKPKAIVYDEEFSEVLEDAGRRRKRYIAWAEPEAETKDPTLESLIERGDRSGVIPPKEAGKAVILTSGTTGTPKGASRSQPKSLDPVAALLDRIPLKAREKTMIAAPLFHAWGFAHFTLALGLSSTIVLRRKFDPEATLSATAQHGCTALVVVPVMLQRILDLDDEVLDRYDLSTVKAVPVSGSALAPAVSERWMDHFGDNLYNLYGSTEVAWATIATPQDLREAPGTSGRPPRGTVVRIYDDDGNPVDAGDTGRIFVGNDLQFEGYTGGGGKDVIDGLMSSGDVGHFDDDGRLFVDGRDDDMIVSGGENVFPQEVEELLEGHESISEAAVFGVDDEEFGQRLKAVVVTKGGKQLSEDEVKKYVKSNLAGYKVPRDVEFIDELPRTSTGKVLKRELKEDGDEDGEGGDDGKSNGKSDGKKQSGSSAKKSSGSGKKKAAKKG